MHVPTVAFLSVCLVKVFSGVVTERATTTSLDKEAAAPAQVGALLHCACRASYLMNLMVCWV